MKPSFGSQLSEKASPRQGRRRISVRTSNNDALVPLWQRISPSYSAKARRSSNGNGPAWERIEIRGGHLLCFEQNEFQFSEPTVQPIYLENCSVKSQTISEAGSKFYSVILKLYLGVSTMQFDFTERETAEKFLHVCEHLSSPTSIRDFEPIATIGRGKWGKVMVCFKHGDEEEKIYAVKEVEVRNMRTVRHSQDELLVMQKINGNDFVVGLQYSMKCGAHLYFVLDFMPGGDLYSTLRRNFLSTKAAVFYAAEILLALEHIHSKQIVHRDLKPENVLVDHEGHVKLADFGLSKILEHNLTTNTLCGTEVYAAPEMLSKQDYGFSVDFWQFGCFVYELHVGQSPFHSYIYDKTVLREKILHGNAKFPHDFPLEAKHTILNLLQNDPANRLGCNCDGWSAVKKSDFFMTLDWTLAKSKSLQPPISSVEDGTDVLENFDETFVLEKASFVGNESYELPCEKDFVGFYFNAKL